jgi:pimeloyl-ACP methyl ester carboxylesterase
MKALAAIFLSLLLLMISGFAFATSTENFNGETYKGFVKIRGGRELFVNYVKPEVGQPTLIILNGLTYSTVQWDRFAASLEKRGVGLLRYDMYGMGQTLLKYAPATAVISYQDQVEDLKKLLTVMKLKGPYNFVGLSYGGGIGLAYSFLYPQDIKNLILMAPYTEALEGQYNWIMAQIWATRQIYPANPAGDDELYDYFLHQIVYSTYPQSEPVVMQNPFILEGVFRMVQGIRKFRPLDLVDQMPAHTYLMIAEYDQYIPRKVLNSFWDKVPAASKGGCVIIKNSEHKIPEAQPAMAAKWVYEILQGASHASSKCN